VSCKLLKGNGLSRVYRRTGRNFAFFRGGGGGINFLVNSGRVRSGDGRRGRGACCASGGQGKLRPAAGVARGLHRFRQDKEQKLYYVGYGGVVVGRNLPRLAVEFGFDSYGDVSDGSHGPAFERRQEFALLVVCAKGE